MEETAKAARETIKELEGGLWSDGTGRPFALLGSSLRNQEDAKAVFKYIATQPPFYLEVYDTAKKLKGHLCM